MTDGLASYGAAKARLPELAHFRARRHLLAASEHRTVRHIRYAAWRALSGTLGLHVRAATLRVASRGRNGSVGHPPEFT